MRGGGGIVRWGSEGVGGENLNEHFDILQHENVEGMRRRRKESGRER